MAFSWPLLFVWLVCSFLTAVGRRVSAKEALTLENESSSDQWTTVETIDEEETMQLGHTVHTEESCPDCYQGDISLPPGANVSSLLEAGVGAGGRPWPNGVVLYVWKDGIHPKAKEATLAAMQIWERKSCARFEELRCTVEVRPMGRDLNAACAAWANSGQCMTNSRYMKQQCAKSCQLQDQDTSCAAWAARGECGKNPQYMRSNCPKSCGVCHKSYPVRIGSNKAGCNAHAGYYAADWQDMNLAEGCWHVGTALHELGHVLGLHHEHERFDRDQYVEAHLENVEANLRRWFGVSAWRSARLRELPYDLSSIMHYEAWAFAKQRNYRDLGTASLTVKKKDSYGNCKIGQRTQLSIGDMLTVAALYGCEAVAPAGDRSQWMDRSCQDTSYRGRSCHGIATRTFHDGSLYCSYVAVQEACPRSCGSCPAEVFC